MTLCPSGETLQQYLREELSDEDRSALEEHVESCARCQEWLERLTETETTVALSHGPRSAPTGEGAGLSAGAEAFLERMKTTPPAAGSLAWETTQGAGGGEEWPAIPGYEVLGQLGRGAAGVVYKARQVELDRVVALKMILAAGHEQPEDRLRFRLEAELLARLRHPNIVQIHEVGSFHGRPFFALEFVDGDRLADRLDGTCHAPGAAAELVEAVARTVHAAHLAGIVHRDLKPGNILLARKAPGSSSSDHGRLTTSYGIPMIVDFGLAKQFDREVTLTRTNSVLGTPRYMAPEQCRTGLPAIGPATDVYALGTILYELLTGHVPFASRDVLQVLQQIVEEEPRPPRRQVPAIPRDLECICLRCLEKEPRKRYASAEALAEDLRRFLDGEPIKARHVGRLERTWKWARRRPLVAALLLGLLLSTALGVAGVTGAMLYAFAGWDTAEQKEQDALAARDASRLQAARLILDKGLALAEQGEVGRGLHYLRRSLESVPDEETHLQRLIRINLAAWGRQVHGLRHTLEHPLEVHAVTLHSDGRTAVTGCADGLVYRWDTTTGQPAGPPLRASGPVWAVACSPDGKLIAAGGGNWVSGRGDFDCTAQVWEAATGRPVGQPFAHPRRVWSVAFSPDSCRLATAGNDERVRLWDVSSGTQVAAFVRPARDIHAVAFSPDGRLAAANNDHSIGIWDPAGRQDSQTLRGHTELLWGVAFHPDGRRLASASFDRTVRLWDTVTGQALGGPLWHPEGVNAVAFSPDGAALVTGCRDGLARVWDTATGRPLGSRLRHRSNVFAVAFAADGMTIVTSSGDHTARVWQFGRSLSRPAETTSQQKPKSSPVVGRRATAAPGPTIESVAYSPDRRIVLTGDRSGLARLWDAATGRPLAVPLRHPHDRIPAVAFGRPLTVPLRHPHDRIRAVAFSPDGRLFATGSHGPVEGGAARIWETATGRPRSPWLPHPSWVSALAFSPDGTLLATGSYDFRVTLWDVATGRPRGAPLRQNDIVLSLAFSPDGRTLAAGTAHDWRRDPQAQLWDVAAGQPRGEPMRHQHWVNLLLFSPDGRTLLTGARDGIARLWDATTGKPLSPPLPHPWECTAAAFSPDGTTVLTGSMDGTARLWRVPDGTPLGLPMLHPAMVPSVAFSPDGRTAAVASADGSAWLWDVATNIPLGPPAVQNAKLRSVAFASDGRAFLTTGDDGTTRAWPVPAPLEGDGESLTLRLQVRTGLEMDATGQAVLPLTVADWEQRRQRLAALDGSPDGALGPGVDEAAWHDARARDAEQDGDLFAARWHLDRLIARDPTDWLLYARRGRVHSTQGRFDLALADYRNAAAHGSPPMLRDWFAHRVVDCGLSGQKGAAAWYAFHLLGGF